MQARSQCHAPAALVRGNKPRYWFSRRSGKLHNLFRRLGKKNILPLPGFEPRLTHTNREYRIMSQNYYQDIWRHEVCHLHTSSALQWGPPTTTWWWVGPINRSGQFERENIFRTYWKSKNDHSIIISTVSYLHQLAWPSISKIGKTCGTKSKIENKLKTGSGQSPLADRANSIMYLIHRAESFLKN